jgi:probable metal-binding protein
MPQAHIHDVLEMINTTKEAYSEQELQAAIVTQFGDEMRFSSCSIEGMDSAKAVEFLVTRGKFVPKKSGTACCGACGG